jgi:excisionase family DNA binding protein
MPELMRVVDVAQTMGLHRTRVYELIADKQIPAVRIGGRIVVPRATFDAWMAEKGSQAMENCQAVREGNANG